MKGYLMLGITTLLVGINIISFSVCAKDKDYARRNRMRIRESFMIRLSIFFGSLGMLAGMLFFRHKIRKPLFFISVPLLLIAQSIIVFLSYYFLFFR
ncbi:MAG: DUF1294 domain-containing protein [Ruminococcaceae bacterium]|nr:DUF1294 domain-containing protein [Oscillospiraceae bacterium]